MTPVALEHLFAMALIPCCCLSNS